MLRRLGCVTDERHTVKRKFECLGTNSLRRNATLRHKSTLQSATGIPAKDQMQMRLSTLRPAASGTVVPALQVGPALVAAHAGNRRRLRVCGFLHDALLGYAAPELMARGRHIASALHRHLPQDYAGAVAILVASAAQPVARVVGSGMGGFLFMPHLAYIAEYGLAHFEPSMRAVHALTPRFTAEFAIRPFLQHHTARALAQLDRWADDPSDHVRCLVSEGSWPRLPWASQLAQFQHDPQPVLRLLERLKDDALLYVRRSVADNLNDIGKDHPQLLADTARRWLVAATPEREWVVRHALRWAVKRGHAQALDALGFGARAQVRLDEACLRPEVVPLGGDVQLAFVLHNTAGQAPDLLIDLQVHFVKASMARRQREVRS